MKSTFKIVGLYVLGALLILLFFYINNSDNLKEFIEKADDFRAHWGFGFYAVIGLIKFVSLVAGALILVILTVLLIRKRIKRPTTTYKNNA